MENNNCCRTCKYWTCEDFESGLFVGKCEIFDCLTVDEYICELYEPVVDLEKELKWLKEL